MISDEQIEAIIGRVSTQWIKDGAPEGASLRLARAVAESAHVAALNDAAQEAFRWANARKEKSGGGLLRAYAMRLLKLKVKP